MPRYKAMVNRIDHGQATLLLEDGSRLVFPVSKLPKGACEGTFLQISISVDRLAALLRKPSHALLPKGAKG